MSKTATIIMWTANIILYSLNIVLACVKGPSLVTCICGWASSIILALGMMISAIIRINNYNKRWEYNNEQTTTKNEEHS